jgi:hypothetical protein
MRDLHDLVGEKLAGLDYVQLRWDEMPTSESPVDDVAIAVRLRFESGRVLEIGWEVDYGFEQLRVGVGSQARDQEVYRVSDASDRWRMLADRTCEDVDFYMHRCADGSVRPWAQRMKFDTRVLVVALGTWGDSGAAYSADNLIVTGAPSLLRDYRPTAALTFPWGDEG